MSELDLYDDPYLKEGLVDVMQADLTVKKCNEVIPEARLEALLGEDWLGEDFEGEKWWTPLFMRCTAWTQRIGLLTWTFKAKPEEDTGSSSSNTPLS